jgi:hypothetical protein
MLFSSRSETFFENRFVLQPPVSPTLRSANRHGASPARVQTEKGKNDNGLTVDIPLVAVFPVSAFPFPFPCVTSPGMAQKTPNRCPSEIPHRAEISS